MNGFPRFARSLVAAAVLATSVGIVVLPATAAHADVNVATIDAGSGQTCAVTVAGGAKCWGSGPDGELGNGLNGYGTMALAPTDVTGLTSGVASVAAGGGFSCALTTGGAVKCWGFDGNNELGDGNFTESPVPVDVNGLSSGVAAISAGANACALTTGGGVKCWGDNTFGQIGDGTQGGSAAPRDVSGLTSGVAAISSGGAYSCALTTGGAVKCWGNNQDGRLGDGTTIERHAPVNVVGLGSGVAAISAGDNHACALLDDGTVKCWGNNAQGALGDGTTTDRHTPVVVTGLGADIAKVDAGGWHTCAVTVAGALKCWGRNDFGQLGTATSDDALTPVDVVSLDAGVTAISLGSVHTCALTGAGAAHCFGYNVEGELGDGLGGQSSVPIGVDTLGSSGVAIGSGYQHSCAVTTGGALKCWGLNTFGQLGDGTHIERDAPVGVTDLDSGVASVVGGVDYTCALTTTGAAECWGNNSDGQLGDGTLHTRSTPNGVDGLDTGVAQLSAGVQHTCAVTTDGAAKCWGLNFDGSLGDGSNTERTSPVQVSGLDSGVAAISAGADHTCALTDGGAVKCWGSGGDLGDGSTQGSNVPVDVSGLSSGVTAIAADSDQTCAITATAHVKCWGFLYNVGFAGTPVVVAGLNSVVQLSAGASSMCARIADGTVQCWGYNGFGELGDGTTTDSTSPVVVSGLTDVTEIAARGDHACALDGAGTVQCWGYNANGQLGAGISGHSLVPVGVVGLGLGGAGVAAAPAQLTTASNNGAVTISWKAAAHNGGAAVYGYAVKVLDAGGGRATGVTGARVRFTNTTTFHFSGLTNGTSYRLDVSPLNRAGMGASALSKIVSPGATPPPPPPPPPVPPSGYWMAGATGSVYTFGHVTNHGSATASNSAVTHIEATPSGRGYWVVNAAGSVFEYGDAAHLSGAGALSMGERVTGLSSTPTGHGYWLFTTRGRVIPRGDAHFYGDMRAARLNSPIIGSAATPTGHGYFLLGADGGVFTYGDAKFRGSMGGAHLNRPVVGIVPTANNHGYWLVGADGGVFAFGNAGFRGSMGATRLNRPVVGMIRYGNGYLMAASDGGVFDFSNKPFAGSLAGHPPTRPIVSIAATR